MSTNTNNSVIPQSGSYQNVNEQMKLPDISYRYDSLAIEMNGMLMGGGGEPPHD